MIAQNICRDFNGTLLEIKTDETFSIALPGFPVLNCVSSVKGGNIEPAGFNWNVCEETDNRVCLVGENELGKWRLEFAAAMNLTGINGISVKMSGDLRQAQPDLDVAVLKIASLKADHILTQGIAMGGCSSINLPANTSFSSHYQTMISAGDHILQIGYPLMQQQPGKVHGKIHAHELQDVLVSYRISHFGLKKIDLDPVTLFAAKDGFQLMYDWADANIEVKKDFTDMTAPGWNSWDYYRWTITEEEVLKNAEFIAHDPVLSKHVKRIIVDDGWQYCYGEWEANHLFPNGMAYLAKEIKKMGFVPGLWFAPTIVEPHARIAQMDYDMLAMGESGKPCLSFQCMKRHGFVLDPTVPKVRKYLFDMFKRYADMGYGYFKLDFLGSTLGARQFADASVPRSQIVRKIVEPVYEAVNGKARILGCNYNFESGNKVVDAVRVGGDIHATWKGICHNVASVAARFWGNKRLWLNDPDFALCRSLDTANDPDMTRLLCGLVYITPEMTDSKFCEFPLVDEVFRPQAEILLSIVLAAAGAVNLSDNLPRLNARGLELARRVVGADSGDAAIPVDLFCSDKPSYWLQKVKDYHRVLLINWNDEPGTYSFDLKKYGVTADLAVNFWNDQIVKINDGVISVELQPRSCLLAVVK
jgi:hypothetical protein